VQIFARTPEFNLLLPYASMAERWFSPDYFIAHQEHQYRNQKCLGEGFHMAWYTLGPILGTALFGREPEFDKTTSWFHPFVENIADAPLPAFDLNTGFSRKLMGLYSARSLLDRDRFFPAHCDIGGPGDAVTNILGTQKFLESTLLEEEALKALIDRTADMVRSYFWAIDNAVTGNEIYSDWLNLLFPGKGYTIGEDCTVMMDPESVHKLIIPSIKKAIAGIPYAVFHLHTAGMHTLDAILSLPEIKGVQVSLDPQNPLHEEFLDDFKKILRSGRTLVLTPEPPEIDTLCRALPAEGVIYGFNTRTVEEGEAYINKISGFYK
ncbi:MAG: hypothetical protein A2487_18220, partial [Candidatus Raymondbacteria bacterium RifOxyC12_full_50_8]